MIMSLLQKILFEKNPSNVGMQAEDTAAAFELACGAAQASAEQAR